MKLTQWGELDQPPQEQKPQYVSLAHIASRLREVVKLGPESITDEEMTFLAACIDHWNYMNRPHDR